MNKISCQIALLIFGLILLASMSVLIDKYETRTAQLISCKTELTDMTMRYVYKARYSSTLELELAQAYKDMCKFKGGGDKKCEQIAIRSLNSLVDDAWKDYYKPIKGMTQKPEIVW